MVIQNATKLLPLTIQTKLTLTVTLTLTDTVTVIFYMHFVDTHKRYHINKRNFSRRSVAGFVGGPIFCTTQQPVCYTSDKKSIVHALSLKEGFCGVYKEKGAKSFGGMADETKFGKEYIFFRGIAKTQIVPQINWGAYFLESAMPPKFFGVYPKFYSAAMCSRAWRIQWPGFDSARARPPTKELFLIIPMRMMNREIILGRKRGFDGVIYKLWLLQASWSSNIKSACRAGVSWSKYDLAGRWLA